MNTPYKIAIIGLGYVGLPLARLFATKYQVVGFDINKARIGELNGGTDSTLEVSDEVLQSVLISENPFTSGATTGLYCSSDLNNIKDANIYIVTVPTPVDKIIVLILRHYIKHLKQWGKCLKKEMWLFMNLLCIRVSLKKSVFQFLREYLA